jgi:hypothetical protein
VCVCVCVCMRYTYILFRHDPSFTECIDEKHAIVDVSSSAEFAVHTSVREVAGEKVSGCTNGLAIVDAYPVRS